MAGSATAREGSLIGSWMMSCAWGWMLGLVLVVALAAIWDLFGGGAQFMVGIGVGAGVGFAQGRVVSRYGVGARAWLIASVAGAGLPFVAADLLAHFAGWPFLLPPYVLVAGSLVGAGQAWVLHPRTRRAPWWGPASLVGWAVPAGMVAVGDALPGFAGGLLSLTAILLGGVFLGAVTAPALAWIVTAGSPERTAG
jgi:hypothetical protein